MGLDEMRVLTIERLSRGDVGDVGYDAKYVIPL